MSTDRWMNQQDLVYNGTLFNLKKKETPTCTVIDKPWRYSAQWNKPVTEEQIL